ncbi:MAG: sodium:melibiose symporter [Spirochaetae bacterium HGW-Spirochaetae-3]|nr:MAG: sodium:melibiose symporter [Spirochaetae bacterium HGW-Spirochaetae-3]
MKAGTPALRLPTRIKVAYSIGQLGWSILSGIIQVWLVWFYNPPASVDIPALIPGGAVLGFFTIIGLITMSGRFLDAVTDPWIANLSDRSRNPRGRRIPFMAKASVPFAALTVMIFMPPTPGSSAVNVVWLAVTLLAYYVFYTMYVAPYFALTPELSSNADDRLDLSTYIALTWFVGYIIASGASFIWPMFQSAGFSLVASIRITLGILAGLGFVLLLVPVLTIDERKYVRSEPTSLPPVASIKAMLSNRNFLLFEIFFLAYGIAITVFQTGNVYYVTVLLGFTESAVLYITAATGILAFMLYPLVNMLSKRVGKKPLCFGAMGLLILAYLYCAFLGRMALPAALQAAIFVLLAGIGFAVFGILPNAIVADLAEVDGRRSGERKEGMFYAVHTFMSKIGQMVAMLIFSSLLLLGKDPGNDLGIRLTGVVAAGIGFASLVIFSFYREERA